MIPACETNGGAGGGPAAASAGGGVGVGVGGCASGALRGGPAALATGGTLATLLLRAPATLPRAVRPARRSSSARSRSATSAAIRWASSSRPGPPSITASISDLRLSACATMVKGSWWGFFSASGGGGSMSAARMTFPADPPSDSFDVIISSNVLNCGFRFEQRTGGFRTGRECAFDRFEPQGTRTEVEQVERAFEQCFARRPPRRGRAPSRRGGRRSRSASRGCPGPGNPGAAAAERWGGEGLSVHAAG